MNYVTVQVMADDGEIVTVLQNVDSKSQVTTLHHMTTVSKQISIKLQDTSLLSVLAKPLRSVMVSIVLGNNQRAARDWEILPRTITIVVNPDEYNPVYDFNNPNRKEEAEDTYRQINAALVVAATAKVLEQMCNNALRVVHD